MKNKLEDKEQIIQAIKTAANISTKESLIFKDFKGITGISINQVLKHFDSWAEACDAAGIKHGDSLKNLEPYTRRSKGKQHAISEMKKVSEKLNAKTLSKSQYNNQNPEIKANAVARMFGGWENALRAAGLDRHPLFYNEIPLEDLAQEFLSVFRELKRIPTFQQLSRRSSYSKYCFSVKFDGGFRTFKIEAVRHLLVHKELQDDERSMLESHLVSISDSKDKRSENLPHARGRHLGFRQFAFVPTSEQDVVSMFGSVAYDLGFEIVSNRQAFPDCEARRKYTKRGAYRKCLIEYEFQSNDYKKHKHPLSGCDLIVCCEHNWADCPIEVLELKEAIKKLP